LLGSSLCHVATAARLSASAHARRTLSGEPAVPMSVSSTCGHAGARLRPSSVASAALRAALSALSVASKQRATDSRSFGDMRAGILAQLRIMCVVPCQCNAMSRESQLET
jgi:hypothetical protein